LNNPICSYTNAITSNGIGEILFSNPAGIFSSADGGINWINQGLQGQSIFAVKGMKDNSVFVSLAGSGTHIYKSVNNGHAGSWVASDNGFVGNTATYFAENNAGIKYAGIGWQRQVLTSTNTTGSLWTPNSPVAQSGMPQNTVTTAINVNAQGHIFTGMENFGVYRSTDGGITFQWLGFSGGDMSAIQFNSSGEVFVSKAGGSNNSGVYRSSNNGTSWSSNLLPNAGVVNCLYIAPNNDIYAGTTTGMYKSSDNGQSFIPINAGLPTRYILSLHKGADNYLYAGTAGRGIFKTSTSIVTSVSNIPPVQQLLNIFPNPASDIFYVDLPAGLSSGLSITLYSTLGSVILQKYLQQQTRRVPISIKGMVPGFYICILADQRNVFRTGLLVK
jgi:hypothetical protein